MGQLAEQVRQAVEHPQREHVRVGGDAEYRGEHVGAVRGDSGCTDVGVEDSAEPGHASLDPHLVADDHDQVKAAVQGARDAVELGHVVDLGEFRTQPLRLSRTVSDHGDAALPRPDQQELVGGERAYKPRASRRVGRQRLGCRKAVGCLPENVLIRENSEVRTDATDHWSSGENDRYFCVEFLLSIR